MRVTVTQKHINKGRVDAFHCPISLAIKDKQHKIAQTMYTNCWIFNPKRGFSDRYVLPVIAQVFVNRFDNKERVEPFEFEMKKYTKS